MNNAFDDEFGLSLKRKKTTKNSFSIKTMRQRIKNVKNCYVGVRTAI